MTLKIEHTIRETINNSSELQNVELSFTIIYIFKNKMSLFL